MDEVQQALVHPNQLCEHVSRSFAELVKTDPIGYRRILYGRSHDSIFPKLHTRIDRVAGGFLVYHSRKIRELRAIEPRFFD
jgi:hypothetical protein